MACRPRQQICVWHYCGIGDSARKLLTRDGFATAVTAPVTEICARRKRALMPRSPSIRRISRTGRGPVGYRP
jgi:hypothetical protein